MLKRLILALVVSAALVAALASATSATPSQHVTIIAGTGAYERLHGQRTVVGTATTPWR